MSNILLIEDHPSQRAALEEYLSGKAGGSHTVYAAMDGATAQLVLSDRKVDLIVSDLMLPDATGIDLLRMAKEKGATVPFLILTGQPSIETAVEAIQAGASDYLLKPVDLRLLKNKIDVLLETANLKSENLRLKARIQEEFSTKSIIGSSVALRSIIEKIRHVAPSDVTVLLEGESGTGKELFANLIHENSSRAGKPFIKVNCGALTKTLLESELFGVVKGAYTGAVGDRIGYFEAADGGTIFLDEIGEMDIESQVRLLRVIEEREVVRIGSTKPRKIDVRIIAATNRSLLSDTSSGKFREDLYYRLAVIRMTLPPLRERTDDIPLLFNHFVVTFNEKYHKSVARMSPDLLKFFQTYDWPGNIRQLRNVLEGMVVLAGDDTLLKENLPEGLTNTSRTNMESSLYDSIITGISLEDYEKAIISRNLAHCDGAREETAKILKISARTLYRKLKTYNL